MVRGPTTDQRVQSILDKMTLKDKVAQMAQVDLNNMLFHGSDGKYYLYTQQADFYFGQLGVGSLLNTPTKEPWTAETYRDAMMQINNITQTYGRPPVIWGLDSIHGANYIHNATITPQPINLAATFNLTQAYMAGKLASRDTRAAGVQWLFSPLLGLSLEPRWSRVFETFGEDPLLVSHFAAQMITGIQAIDNDEYNAVPQQAAACAKHFVGYSKPWNGHDRSPSWIPTRHLWQYFMIPWKRALLHESYNYDTPMTVMESYTEYDGVPIVAYPYALEYILRERLGYNDGVLITDYQEIRNLDSWHHIVPNAEVAQVYALQHGTVDMSMVPNEIEDWINSTMTGVEQGEIPMDRIDMSVLRILRMKEKLGMFENVNKLNMNDPNLAKVGTDDALAADMARESLILAKNDGNLLPLSKSATSTLKSATTNFNISVENNEPLKILVTGPTADSLVYQSGAWTWQWQGPRVNETDIWFTRGTTVLQALTAEQNGGVGTSDNNWQVSYTCGVDIAGMSCDNTGATEPQDSENILNMVEDWVMEKIGDSNVTSLTHAVQQAQGKDVVIVCVGEKSETEKPGDSRVMTMAQGQYDLVRAIKEQSDAKIVLVYFGGRPRLLLDMAVHADAIIMAFLPGPTAGIAVADVLTGRYNPSGRMPITYPLSDDNAGLPYYHAVSDLCPTADNVYVYEPCKVQFPFGHGLSYTSFAYRNLSASGGNGQDLGLSVQVENTGDVSGSEVVMFFTFDNYRSVTPEYKRLRAFTKVHLDPGESTSVYITVPAEDLAFIGPNDDSHYIYQPDMTFYVGVGYDTDCRMQPDADTCVFVEPTTTVSDYDPACAEACQLWEDSRCSLAYGMTPTLCNDMCMESVGLSPQVLYVEDQAWGWTYVRCLENVIAGFEAENGNRNCQMMTQMCRDVFKTTGMDEYGIRSTDMRSVSATALTGNAWTGSLVAFSAGAIVSLFIAFVARGVRCRRKRRNLEASRVQFAPVNTNLV